MQSIKQCAHESANTHIHMYMYTCTYIYTHIYRCIYIYVYTHLDVHRYVHMYICIHIYICAHVCLHACMHTCICIHAVHRYIAPDKRLPHSSPCQDKIKALEAAGVGASGAKMPWRRLGGIAGLQGVWSSSNMGLCIYSSICLSI